MATETLEVVAPTHAQVTDTPEVVSPETVTDEPKLEGAEGADKPEAGEDDAEKQRRKMQRAIQRQAAKRYEEKARADQLEARVKELEQLSGGDEGEKPISPADIERLAAQRAREMRATEALEAKADAVLKAGRKIDGFDEARDALWAEVSPWAKNGKPTPFLEALMDTEKPAEVIAYLGRNTDEAAEFADLSPVQIGRRLAKLESKLESMKAKPQGEKLPKPLEPVTARAVPTKSALDMSFEEYSRMRRKQLGY